MAPAFNSKSPTIRRIMREAAELKNAPSEDYVATPLDDNLFEWHFTISGPPGPPPPPLPAGLSPSDISPDSPHFATLRGTGPYSAGIYHGRIVLPPTYPLRPPSFRFLTPSGRFEPNREICLSISGHHEETWQPAWGIRTALVALRAFMETDAKGQLGGMECSEKQRRDLALKSRSWKCAACGMDNEAILKEAEKACKEKEKEATENGESSTVKKVEEVPAELRLGFRDEMEKGKIGEASKGVVEDAESAELAEGFVQTAPTPPRDENTEPAAPAAGGSGSQAPTVTSLQQQSPGYPAAQPAQTVPRPTGTIPAPTATRLQTHHQAAIARNVNSQDGVPVWVDRAIFGVCVALLAMMLKLLLW